MFTKLWNWIKSWFKNEEMEIVSFYNKISHWVTAREHLITLGFKDEVAKVEAKIKELVAKL